MQVMSVSWNTHVRNLVASGSADGSAKVCTLRTVAGAYGYSGACPLASVTLASILPSMLLMSPWTSFPFLFHQVWDLTTQKCMGTMKHHADKVQSIAWHTSEVSSEDVVQEIVDSSESSALIHEKLTSCSCACSVVEACCVCDRVTSAPPPHRLASWPRALSIGRVWCSTRAR